MSGHTIWRHWPRQSRGDFAWRCDYCGMAWRRSQLRIDGSGLYVCPDDEGTDTVTLTETNLALTPEAGNRGTPGQGFY